MTTGIIFLNLWSHCYSGPAPFLVDSPTTGPVVPLRCNAGFNNKSIQLYRGLKHLHAIFQLYKILVEALIWVYLNSNFETACRIHEP